MRSAKSVKRNRITKHAYENKSHKKQSAKKAMFTRKEWKKTTYSCERKEIVIDFASVAKQNTFYGVPVTQVVDKEEHKKEQIKKEPIKQQKKENKSKGKKTPKPKVKEQVKSEQKVEKKVEVIAQVQNEIKKEQKIEPKQAPKAEIKEEKKIEKEVISEAPKSSSTVNESVKNEAIQNPLTVDVSNKGDVKGMKASVDSGIDFNNAAHSTGSTSPQDDKSGSPSRSAASGNSFFESVSKIVQTALGTAESKPISRLQINHNGGGRQRTHKLLPRDVKFCVKMLEKYGEDFEAMSKSEDNVYMDTPSGIKRKVRIFKESPQYEQWQKAKLEGKTIDDVLSC